MSRDFKDDSHGQKENYMMLENGTGDTAVQSGQKDDLELRFEYEDIILR